MGMGARPLGAGGGHCGAGVFDACPCPSSSGFFGGHVCGGGSLGPGGAGEVLADPPPSEEPPPKDSVRPGGGAFLSDFSCSAAGSDDGFSSIDIADLRDWSLSVADSPFLAVSNTGWKSANVGYVPSAVARQPAFTC